MRLLIGNVIKNDNIVENKNDVKNETVETSSKSSDSNDEYFSTSKLDRDEKDAQNQNLIYREMETKNEKIHISNK